MQGGGQVKIFRLKLQNLHFIAWHRVFERF